MVTGLFARSQCGADNGSVAVCRVVVNHVNSVVICQYESLHFITICSSSCPFPRKQSAAYYTEPYI